MRHMWQSNHIAQANADPWAQEKHVILLLGLHARSSALPKSRSMRQDPVQGYSSGLSVGANKPAQLTRPDSAA